MEPKTAEQLKAELDALRAEAAARKARERELREQLAAMKKAAPRISRYAITAQVVMANSGKTVKELSALADAAYVSAGGKANEKESLFTTGRVVSALVGVGLVTSNGHVTVVGCVVPQAQQAQAKQPQAHTPQGKGK